MHYSHGGASAYPYLFSLRSINIAILSLSLRPFESSHTALLSRIPTTTYVRPFATHILQKLTFLLGKGTCNIHFQDTALLSIGRLCGEVVCYIHIYVLGYHRRLFIPAIYTFVLMLYFLSTQSEHR